MWPFKKKREDPVWLVTYVLGAYIDNTDEAHVKVTFDLNYASTMAIRAKTASEAQTIFAGRVALSPHVYIHKIEKTEVFT